MQAQAETLQAYAGFAQACAGIAGALAVVWAAKVARETFGSTLEGKRAEAAFELARKTIEFAAQASPVFSSIRSPFGNFDEGKTRTKRANETAEEAEVADELHVMYERIRKHDNFWQNGRDLQFQLQAIFSEELKEAVTEILVQQGKLNFHWQNYCTLKNKTTQLTEPQSLRLEESELIIWDQSTTAANGQQKDLFTKHIEKQQQILINGLQAYVRVPHSSIAVADEKNIVPWWQKSIQN